MKANMGELGELFFVINSDIVSNAVGKEWAENYISFFKPEYEELYNQDRDL